jgi:hypothetical protein
MFRRFGHLAVLVIDGENIFPRDVKFCPVRGELFVIVYVCFDVFFEYNLTFSCFYSRLGFNINFLGVIVSTLD